MENKVETGVAPSRRALIIRSGPSWLFEKALKILKSDDMIAIDVYCPKGVTAQLADRSELDRIIDDEWEGFFRNSFITPALLAKLSGYQYDQVVILYNDAFGEGYGPLRKLAFAIGAKEVSSLNINMVFSGMASEGILGRFFLPRKWFYTTMVVIFSMEIVVTALIDRTAFALKRLFGVRPPLPPKHTR